MRKLSRLLFIAMVFLTSSVAAAQEKPKDVEGGLKSNMQGTILSIKVQKGDKIKKGDVVVTIEAMKMEQEIKSDGAGEVKDIFVAEGDSVASGDLLIQVL